MPQTGKESLGRHPADPPASADALRAKLALELGEGRTDPLDAPTVPDHTLVHRIGSGSYGDVWLARSALGTPRAIKIVYRARFKDDRPYEREFQGILKYEPVSRTHEWLVQVLHVGRNDAIGCFYYVMELADNAGPAWMTDRSDAGISAASVTTYRPRTLANDLARHVRLPAAEAARLTLLLAKAVGHLHNRGLVHRDIKPSNVIFVGGQPKLADIGLVTDLGTSRSFVGTEGFIPPEGPGTPQADIYGLGKLLYELATGRDRMEFPQLPPRVDRLPDGQALLELNEVITRACAPAVQERYATAPELEADLNSFLAGRSLRRARNIERYVLRLKRIVAVTLVLLAILATALWFSKREERHALETARLAVERAEAEAQSRATEVQLRRRAEAAESETEQQLYTALLEQSRATVRSGKPGQRFQALDAIRRAAAITNRVELRREAIAALALPDLRLKHQIPLGAEFTMQQLDPPLERIALCRGSGAVEVRTVPAYQLLATLPASTNLIAWSGSWSQDGRFLAIKRDYDTGERADLEVWDVEKVSRILLLHDVRNNTRAFHPTEPQLLVAMGDGEIVLWDLETGKELSRHKLGVGSESLAYSPDGTLVVASYIMNNAWGVSTHRAADGAMVASHRFTNIVSAVVWHPDGQRMAVTDHGGQVHLMDAQKGELWTLGTHKAEAATAAFTPSGDYLVTGGWERELICWDVRTGQRALAISLDSYVPQFSADGRSLALITQTRVQIHEFVSPTQRVFGPEIGPRLWHAVFSPDGRWLAASADKRIGVWDLNGASTGTRVEIGSGPQLFWTPDSRELLGSSRSEKFFRWQIRTGATAHTPPTVQSMDLTGPQGFVSFCLSSNLIIWTSSSGSQIRTLESPAAEGNWIRTAQGISRTSRDGSRLGIYRAYGQVLHLYEMPGFKPLAKLTNAENILGFDFSPSSDELVIACRNQVEFWNTKTWERSRKPADFHGYHLLGAIFEPDGRSMWLVKNYVACLYDATTLELIVSLPDGMFPLAFDAEGRHLAVSVEAQRLQVWDFVALRQQLRELGLDWEGR